MIQSAIQFFRDLTGIGTNATEPDGFGQSIADDVRYRLNFRGCRKTTVRWRAPTDLEENAIEHQPVLGRLAT